MQVRRVYVAVGLIAAMAAPAWAQKAKANNQAPPAAQPAAQSAVQPALEAPVATALPSDAPVAVPEAPAAAAPAALSVAPAPQAPADTALQTKAPLSVMRQTSYALWGVTGATVLSGTVFALLANSNHKRYKRDYHVDDTHVLRANADVAAAKKLKSRISAQKTVSIVSFSLAAAAAIGGTTLFFLSPEWQKRNEVQVGLLPVQGGALLSLQGAFP